MALAKGVEIGVEEGRGSEMASEVEEGKEIDEVEEGKEVDEGNDKVDGVDSAAIEVLSLDGVTGGAVGETR